jgi:hypothetical protein
MGIKWSNDPTQNGRGGGLPEFFKTDPRLWARCAAVELDDALTGCQFQ